MPNEHLESCCGALWLGIRTFFRFKLGVLVVLESRYAYFTYLPLLTYLPYILTLLTYLPYLHTYLTRLE